MDSCLWCRQPIEQKPRGRRRLYCCDACRKAHARAFPRLPAALRPAPDPGPLPKRSPEDRLALVLADLRASEAECRDLIPHIDSALAWRADNLARAIGEALDYCFKGVC